MAYNVHAHSNKPLFFRSIPLVCRVAERSHSRPRLKGQILWLSTRLLFKGSTSGQPGWRLSKPIHRRTTQDALPRRSSSTASQCIAGARGLPSRRPAVGWFHPRRADRAALTTSFLYRPFPAPGIRPMAPEPDPVDPSFCCLKGKGSERNRGPEGWARFALLHIGTRSRQRFGQRETASTPFPSHNDGTTMQ